MSLYPSIPAAAQVTAFIDHTDTAGWLRPARRGGRGAWQGRPLHAGHSLHPHLCDGHMVKMQHLPGLSKHMQHISFCLSTWRLFDEKMRECALQKLFQFLHFLSP